LYVLVDVVYADLQFILREDGYHARFETSIALVDEEGAEILRDTSRKIRVEDFAMTASKDSAERVYEVLDVPPGEYLLVVSVTDKNSLAHSVRRRRVLLKDFNRMQLAVTEALFYEKLPKDELSPLQAIPGFTGLYPETFFAVAQLIARDRNAPIEVSYKLAIPDGQVLLKESYTHSIPRDGEWIQIELRQEDLRIGENLFQIEVRSGKASDRSVRRFRVRWSGLPQSSGSLEEAIEQLRYVAPPDEWEAMRKASEQQKKKLFEAFWKRRDPTPGTSENELQEEYYTRVAEANQRFAEGAKEGWQTDRGRIYIIYGPPDYVTRESSERDLSTRYEIWYYQRLGQRFIFRDTGGGRFLLVAVRGV
jgi:GWxTD domain-containing protein